MAAKEKVTPAQAKAIFEANPTMKMTDLARQCRVSKNTAYRWRDNDWQDLRAVTRRERNKIRAKAVQRKQRVGLADKAIEKANIEIKKSDLLEVLNTASKMADDGLLKEANRQVLATCIALLKEVANQGVELVKSSPQQVAALVTTLADAIHGSTAAWENVMAILVKAGLPAETLGVVVQPEKPPDPIEELPPPEDDPALGNDEFGDLTAHLKH